MPPRGVADVGDVADVDEASRLLECAQLGRQRRFQQLVRQYLSQMLHGCKSAYCTTPSCLSSTRRRPSRPVRPPTHLTARILTHYLASQDCPERGLCPHELKVPPDAVEIASSSPPSRHAPHNANMADAIRLRRQTSKDVKSLAQNLHDSAAVIYNYSRHIPSPASALAQMRSTPPPPPPQAHHHGPPPDNHPRGIVRQHARQNLRTHSHSPSLHSASRVLSNGSQLHKIPYQLPNPAAHTTRLSNALDAAAVDGVAHPPQLSIKQMSRTSFVTSEGGRIAVSHNKSQLAAPNRTDTALPPTTPNNPRLPVVPILNCHVLDQLKENLRPHPTSDSNHDSYYDSSTSFSHQPTNSFVDRSLYYTLSNPDALLMSFRDSNEAYIDSPLSHLDSSRLTHAFKDWQQRNGALIFDSLWVALEALYVPPPALDNQKSPRLRPSHKSASKEYFAEDESNRRTAIAGAAQFSRYLSNHEAAHIVLICIHALTSLVSVGKAHIWPQIRKPRSCGITVLDQALKSPHLNIIDQLEYEPAIRLADRLLRAVGARTCFEHILASLSRKEKQQKGSEHASADATLIDIIIQHLQVVERVALAKKQGVPPSITSNIDPGWTVTATFMEWLKTVIIKKWDSKAEMNRWSSVGTAVVLLDKLHGRWKSLNLRSDMFGMPFFHERLDVIEEPLKFLNWSEQPNTSHILQYPNLFLKQHLVAYFRTINLTSMMAQYEKTARVHQMQRSLDTFLREPYVWMIKSRMKVMLSDFLVLDISRENPLKDTLDQLWNQEKRMLLKPLKVKMGHQEGEVGLDHGGVTNEFFHIVLSEAFRPENGMFVVDVKSRMTWFQPRALEPTWKFEMLGILFSLAVYNGITLPVTFPLALYHFLLPVDSPFRNREIEPETLDYINDGWPGLAKAFGELLAWSDGDVGDVIMREYAFSFEAFGQKIDHNMALSFGPDEPEWPSLSFSTPDQEDTPLVTNDNREQFVKDYIHYLTYLSVAPQLKAFHKGFLTCINAKSLYFFTPVTLRELVEGRQHISIPNLRACTRYEDGYSASHRVILDFWSIVENYSQEHCRSLLGFVTASDRVPVTGYGSITFHIVRLGGDSENLPTSSTCFGKLYLPEYADKEKLKRKLELALQNSQGFGVV